MPTIDIIERVNSSQGTAIFGGTYGVKRDSGFSFDPVFSKISYLFTLTDATPPGRLTQASRTMGLSSAPAVTLDGATFKKIETTPENDASIRAALLMSFVTRMNLLIDRAAQGDMVAQLLASERTRMLTAVSEAVAPLHLRAFNIPVMLRTKLNIDLDDHDLEVDDAFEVSREQQLSIVRDSLSHFIRRGDAASSIGIETATGDITNSASLNLEDLLSNYQKSTVDILDSVLLGSGMSTTPAATESCEKLLIATGQITVIATSLSAAKSMITTSDVLGLARLHISEISSFVELPKETEDTALAQVALQRYELPRG